MKHVALFALVLAAVLVALALITVPSCLGPLIETPPAWKAQRQRMWQSARETVERLQVRHGDSPEEDWPEEDRLTYRIAVGILEGERP